MRTGNEDPQFDRSAKRVCGSAWTQLRSSNKSETRRRRRVKQEERRRRNKKKKKGITTCGENKWNARCDEEDSGMRYLVGLDEECNMTVVDAMKDFLVYAWNKRQGC
ncbi:hypothetical protein FHG87_022427 [Trinorchestia longiramus]|nr:hypothetical protein FHG87_022427 [Trinorchestia longiramus]